MGFMDILGTVLQQGMSRSSGSRINRGLGGQSGGGLNDLLGNIGSMMNQSPQSGSSRSTSGRGGLGGCPRMALYPKSSDFSENNARNIRYMAVLIF